MKYTNNRPTEVIPHVHTGVRNEHFPQYYTWNNSKKETEMVWFGMDTFLEWKIIVDRRRFTN